MDLRGGVHQWDNQAILRHAKTLCLKIGRLEREVFGIVSNLADNPIHIYRLLKHVKDTTRKAQSVLGKQYRIYVIFESAIPGVHIDRNFRSCVPIFQNTLLLAIKLRTVVSSVASAVMEETFVLSERVAIDDQAISIDTFDLVSTPRALPIRLKSWISGHVVDSSLA